MTTACDSQGYRQDIHRIPNMAETRWPYAYARHGFAGWLPDDDPSACACRSAKHDWDQPHKMETLHNGVDAPGQCNG